MPQASAAQIFADACGLWQKNAALPPALRRPTRPSNACSGRDSGIAYRGSLDEESETPISPSASGSTALNNPEELACSRPARASWACALDEAQPSRCCGWSTSSKPANAQFNLTAIRDRPGMLVKHVLDSLTLQPLPARRASGRRRHRRGLSRPGAGHRQPARHFTLIEAIGKKARFVQQTVSRLGLGNAQVVHARAESYRPANFSIQWRLGPCPRWPISSPMPATCARPAAGCWR